MNEPLWTSDAIARATSGQASVKFAVNGVAFDSREVTPGNLFVAMRGEQADGHDYIAKAITAGAAGVLCERSVDAPHIRVEDSAEALNALGVAARARSRAKIIGVTGSAGKTGTKEALFHALDRKPANRAHRSVKSYNNHVGVPLSLARMHQSMTHGIFEMGMNHSGELSSLTQIVRPHIALVTTVAPAHIGHFSGEEAIADAKAEIFEGLESDGSAIIPFDNPHYGRLRTKAEQHARHIISFGAGDGADVKVIEAVPAASGGSDVTAKVMDHHLVYHIAEPGQHWVMNSLAIMAAVYAAGEDLAIAGLALSELPGLAGRGKRHCVAVDDGQAIIRDESYNANPASMAATISALGAEPASRRIAVLGAMKELGSKSEDYHVQLAEPLIAADVDYVIAVGEEFKQLGKILSQRLENTPRFFQEPDADAALMCLRGLLEAGDTVLVKGSNAMGLAAVVEAIVKGEE